ncbi:ArnT family glycosyltransferase [Arthrobacter sp. C152]
MGILIGAGILYTWALASNGWANAYYTAAVQSGLHDPTAFFFASADWGNSITVDKPPLSLWVIGLSCRIFGLNPWALLLPQVIMTLGSVLLIYKLVKRCCPARTALLASAAFATTPITVLLARYNNPDPLMVVLMLAALCAGISATESGGLRYLLLAASILALGFWAKQLQAFLVLPAIVTIFVFYSSGTWKSKLLSLTASASVLAGGALAWPLLVDLTPSADRPYVGGSLTNSMLELTVGYNGLDRVLKQQADPWSTLLPEAMRNVDSDAGFFRLFNSNYGQEIGWLLVPALISCAAIVLQLFRRKYTRNRATLALASVVWMLTTFFVLSFMGNSFHSYYTASLAAPLALCLAQGAELVLTSIPTAVNRWGTAAALLASFIFYRAMWQLSDAYPELLGSGLFLAGIICIAFLVVPQPLSWIKPAAIWTSAALLAVGPLFCNGLSVTTPQQGSNPLSGGLAKSQYTLSRFMDGIKNDNPAWGKGLAIGNGPSPQLSAYLGGAGPACTWPAATYPGQTAARFQLELHRPVMPLGGFAATDPAPTLRQFQDWVGAGKVCNLVIQPEQLKIPGNSPELLAIHEWVQTNFSPIDVGGTTVYRLVP